MGDDGGKMPPELRASEARQVSKSAGWLGGKSCGIVRVPEPVILLPLLGTGRATFNKVIDAAVQRRFNARLDAVLDGQRSCVPRSKRLNADAHTARRSWSISCCILGTATVTSGEAYIALCSLFQWFQGRKIMRANLLGR